MLNKKFTFAALFAVTLLFVSCKKDNEQMSQNRLSFGSAESTSAIEFNSETPMKLGKKLAISNSVFNMKAAAAFLEANTNEKISHEIEATHYYVKFTPQNEEQERSLEAVKTNNLLTYYPQDYEIENWGFQKPELSSGGFTCLYGTIPVNQLPTDVPYEKIEEIYEPDENETDLEVISSVLCGNGEKLNARFNGDVLDESNILNYLTTAKSGEKASYYPEGWIKIQSYDNHSNIGVGNLKIYLSYGTMSTIVYTDKDGHFKSPKPITTSCAVVVKWENKNGTQINMNYWVTVPDGIYSLMILSANDNRKNLIFDYNENNDEFYYDVCCINNAMNYYNDMIGAANTAESNQNSVIKGLELNTKSIPAIKNSRIWYFSYDNINGRNLYKDNYIHQVYNGLQQNLDIQYMKYLGSACTMGKTYNDAESSLAYINIIRNTERPFFNEVCTMITNNPSKSPDFIYTTPGILREYPFFELEYTIPYITRRLSQYSISSGINSYETTKDLIRKQADFINGQDEKLYENEVESEINMIESYCSLNELLMKEYLNKKFSIGHINWSPDMYNSFEIHTLPVEWYFSYGYDDQNYHLDFQLQHLITPVLCNLVLQRTSYDMWEFCTYSNPWENVGFYGQYDIHIEADLPTSLRRIYNTFKTRNKLLTPLNFFDDFSVNITDINMLVKYRQFMYEFVNYYIYPSLGFTSNNSSEITKIKQWLDENKPAE